MVIKSQRMKNFTFQNLKEDYANFQGLLISSDAITTHNFEQLNIAIIGTDQFTVTHLENLCLIAKDIKVFQISPHYLLPKTDKGVHRLINHPLLIKNRRLFGNRIKTLLSLRYLESQIADPWLKHLLTPNAANLPKKILKSDSYYAALQRDNCELKTWPVQYISSHSIYSIDGLTYKPDIIITTYVEK